MLIFLLGVLASADELYSENYNVEQVGCSGEASWLCKLCKAKGAYQIEDFSNIQIAGQLESTCNTLEEVFKDLTQFVQGEKLIAVIGNSGVCAGVYEVYYSDLEGLYAELNVSYLEEQDLLWDFSQESFPSLVYEKVTLGYGDSYYLETVMVDYEVEDSKSFDLIELNLQRKKIELTSDLARVRYLGVEADLNASFSLVVPYTSESIVNFTIELQSKEQVAFASWVGDISECGNMHVILI